VQFTTLSFGSADSSYLISTQPGIGANFRLEVIATTMTVYEQHAAEPGLIP
jgi:hypothetical protein